MGKCYFSAGHCNVLYSRGREAEGFTCPQIAKRSSLGAMLERRLVCDSDAHHDPDRHPDPVHNLNGHSHGHSGSAQAMHHPSQAASGVIPVCVAWSVLPGYTIFLSYFVVMVPSDNSILHQGVKVGTQRIPGCKAGLFRSIQDAMVSLHANKLPRNQSIVRT
jgi:hypothetical protein